MRWGRKQTQQMQIQQPEFIDKRNKSFSLSDYLPSFSWISKLRPGNKSSKCTSCKPKCTKNPPPPPSPNNPINTKHPALFSPARHVTDPIAPRRRSLGDDEGGRLLLRRRPRHHSTGGELDHNFATSALTLGHLIPFSLSSKGKFPEQVVCDSDRSESDAVLLRRSQRRRRRRCRRRTAVAPTSDLDRTDESRRKSFSGKIRPRSNRVRVNSPRQGRKNNLERFAVVKKSKDPMKDFRESMVEMILEKKIGRPEELESLLACYLTLNADEHHDLIVKVFRQVWFEINPGRLGPRDRFDSRPARQVIL